MTMVLNSSIRLCCNRIWSWSRIWAVDITYDAGTRVVKRPLQRKMKRMTTIRRGHWLPAALMPMTMQKMPPIDVNTVDRLALTVQRTTTCRCLDAIWKSIRVKVLRRMWKSAIRSHWKSTSTNKTCTECTFWIAMYAMDSDGANKI